MIDRRVLCACALVSVVCFAAAPEAADRLLQEAMHAHDAEVKKAETELERAELKFKREKEQADAKLIKAYDDAIKRTTQRGDLESANRLLAERNALKGEAASTTLPSDQAGSESPNIANVLSWAPVPEGGQPPVAFCVADVGEGAVDADYFSVLNAGKISEKIHGHDIERVSVSAEGVYPTPGPHNIQAAYYAFYLQNDTPQSGNLEVRTTPFGTLSLYLDGKILVQHSADNHNAYQTNIPFRLRSGKHVITIKYTNSWADCWIAVKFAGAKLSAGQ